MKKVLLILDMPENCDMCELGFDNEYSDEYECFMEPTKHLESPWAMKPDWCPLHQLPDRKEYDKNIPAMKAHSEDWRNGFNACIEELET